MSAKGWFIFGFILAGINGVMWQNGSLPMWIFGGLLFASPSMIRNHRNKNREVIVDAT